MIFQFSDGEFSDPIATSLKMWKKSIVLSLYAFSVTLEKLNRNPQACPPPQIFLHAFFFSPPTRKLARRSLRWHGRLLAIERFSMLDEQYGMLCYLALETVGTLSLLNYTWRLIFLRKLLILILYSYYYFVSEEMVWQTVPVFDDSPKEIVLKGVNFS